MGADHKPAPTAHSVMTAQTAEDVRVLREALAEDQGTVAGRTGLIAVAHPARIARLLDALERERASRQQAQAELEQAREERNRARQQGERDARRTLQHVIDRAVAAERAACVALKADALAILGDRTPLEATDIVEWFTEAIRARGAATTAQPVPAHIVREAQRAIAAAERPEGMSTHDGKAVIPASHLRYLLAAATGDAA